MAMTANQPAVTVHMIGNAHIDPVWLWTVREGREEVLSTYRTAIALINEFHGYVFTSGGAVTYQWVAEDDPDLFQAIRQAVARGRWAIVNGWWLQPDCNIPSGESFARHALYGQRYLAANLGQRAHTGYNVDSFGHAGTLPQLLKLAGLDYYVFFRPGPHEKTLPQGPFWWEAPGGARVLACRPPLHYGSPDEANIAERIAAAAADAPQGLPVVMCFYGVGNHGGGPTRCNVQGILDLRNSQSILRPVFSAPKRYFEDVLHRSDQWPVVHNELQHHSRGCYTALSRIKRENRQAEHALMCAERLSTMAAVSCGAPKATSRLGEAWQGVLFNQFHDILAGTSIRSAYEDVWRTYEGVRRVAAEVQASALGALSAQVNVADRGKPFLVWNPLPWERTESVRLALPMGDWRYDFRGIRFPRRVEVEDGKGEQVPCQITEVELDHNTYIVHLEARVTVPALGSRALYATIYEDEPPTEAPATVCTDTLENGLYRLRVDPQTGCLASIWDLAHRVEYLSGPAALPLVINDPSDTWSHDVLSFREVCGRFAPIGPGELVHEGSVKRTLRLRSRWGHSMITQDITLYADARAIDVTMTVDWHEQLKMLKLAFPLSLSEPNVTASAPYGWVTRQANGEEEPCQEWVDVSGLADGRERGLCLLNDSKYGYDALGSELRLSILRSPAYAFHQPRQMAPGVTYHYIDQGEQVVRFRLLPHLGHWEVANPVHASYELHEPLIAWPALPHQGPAGDRSWLRVSPDNVVLTVFKLSEDNGRLIVRGYETAGKPARLTLTSGVLGQSWSHDVGPHEIWTLALPLKGGRPERLNLLEEPLP
jgi:alpha-mannosidase